MVIKYLKEMSHDNKIYYILAASFMEKNFYMDDGLGGADSLTIANSATTPGRHGRIRIEFTKMRR